jgi:amidohydrolase
VNLSQIAQNQQDFVVSTRRDLHEHPETRWKENWTLEYIIDEIETMSHVKSPLSADVGEWDIKQLRGGLVIDLTINSSLSRILFRADVDALPIQEETGLPFASEVSGKMHACGHDCHAAMLLGAMRAIASGAVVPTQNIRFVFQRAEENPGTPPEAISGGDMLVQEGVCDGVSSAHMLHIWARGEPGVFLSRPGVFLGNSGRIKFAIKTTGGHAAHPHTGFNALWITHRIQNALDRFAAVNLPPTEPTALEPVILKAGTASNVMPAEAELWYSCRTMLPRDDHARFMDAVESEVQAIVNRSPGSSVEVTKINGHPSLINDTEDFARVRGILERAGEEVEIITPQLGGEDFAHYLYRVPGSAWMLGANQNGCGDHHTPIFNPDESVLRKGVLFWLLLATSE